MRTTTWAIVASLLLGAALGLRAAEPGPVTVSADQQRAAWISAITARIHRAWVEPPSAAAGIQCFVYATLEPGGQVSNVRIGACNADQAVQDSIVKAVEVAAPLPPPPDTALFVPNLVIHFNVPPRSSSSAPASQQPAGAASIVRPNGPVTSTDATVAGHHAGETFRDCTDVCPEMVVIPRGTFQMGAPSSDPKATGDEFPVRTVSIGYSFAVGKYPVTRGQWSAFLAATSRSSTNNCLGFNRSTGQKQEKSAYTWRDPGFPQEDSHPVVCVSWNEAQDYSRWLSEKTGHRYRLLSEAEYEYVNRAGTHSTYFWGDTADGQCRYANGADGTAKAHFSSWWYAAACNDGYVYTSPVGTFNANGFGLYDTTGNVWSWTQDCFHRGYDGAPTDGSAWTTGDCDQHMARGGSWSETSGSLRAAARMFFYREGKLDVGIRVARTD
jgi:formylglycine-generating enzyme required for sulfatase activity